MSKKAQMALFIVVNYIIIKFFYGEVLEEMAIYSSYMFEVLFISFVLLVYKEKFQKPAWPQKKNFVFYMASFVLGFGVYTFANYQRIVVPFDLTSFETLLFLLVIGPILEEFIFRQALWFPLQDLLHNKWLVLISTSILFAYAHFHAYWIYKNDFEVKRFIIYQTAYTLILGFWWGLSYMRVKNVTHPVLLHFAFNLGFFLSFLSVQLF